ncbi:MAG: D-alanyl-D-alanine carboxypeptidase family protein [Ectobacillus sp.]
MKQMRKLALAIMAAVLLFIVPSPSYVHAAQPEVQGQYAVAIDAKTGDILFDKEAHHRAFPASTTKVLTAILLLEHVKPGELISLSQKALEQEKSNYQIELQVGETMDRDTALTILMVLSANDVAYAIAEHISGSAEEFAKLMNEKAKELGAQDSNFVTPSGLHDENHYTTPYDMAMISREVLRHPELMKAMITKRTTVTTSRQTVPIFNKAKFFENPNCIGGKTGFTNEARNTLVEINKRDNNEIINVVMASYNPAIYNDMNLISEHAFSQFAKQNILDKNVWTERASYLDKPVPVELERSVELVLKQGEGQHVQAVFSPLKLADEKLYEEGIAKGEVLGRVDIMKNGMVLDSVKALSKEEVAFEKPFAQKASDVSKGSVSPFVLFGAFIVGIGGIGIALRRRKKSYRA